MRLHKGMYGHHKESALKVDSGRKIPCRTGESNLCQQHASLMLSNIPKKWLYFYIMLKVCKRLSA